MHGEPGTGKTYFCAAMFAYLFDKYNQSCRIYDESGILRRLRGGMNQSSSGDYSQHLISLIDDDLIIIDDLGASGHNEWREEVLLMIVDYRLKSLKPTIFTTNLTPQMMKGVYNPRVIDRIFNKKNLVLESGTYNYRQNPV
jgi:DNA replication protein DnaC